MRLLSLIDVQRTLRFIGSSSSVAIPRWPRCFLNLDARTTTPQGVLVVFATLGMHYRATALASPSVDVLKNSRTRRSR